MNQAELALDLVRYPPGFLRWLRDNRDIYDAFEKRALQMARSGRKHYSAYTIVQVIRWETDLRDKDETFKINNNHTPAMARYFMEQWGKAYPGFFKLRDSLGRDVN